MKHSYNLSACSALLMGLLLLMSLTSCNSYVPPVEGRKVLDGSDKQLKNVVGAADKEGTPMWQVPESVITHIPAVPTVLPTILPTILPTVVTTAENAKEIPPFEEIQEKRKTLPYKEWEQYAKGLAGTQLTGWQGRVAEAYHLQDDEVQYLVQVSLDTPASLGIGQDLLLLFTKTPTSELVKGQNVIITGQVNSVSALIGDVVLIDPQVEILGN